MKRLLTVGVSALLLIAIANFFFRAPQPDLEPAQAKTRPKPIPKIERLPAIVFKPSTPSDPTPPSLETPPANAPSLPTTNIAQGANGKPPIHDLIARAALSDVGLDPEAEEYWLMAINDPTLSPTERQDLIEDLNEDGFDDPDNLTLDDLPLIVSRIEIIEEYAPFAMDNVNAEAFAEAYKDLLNMLAKVTGN